MQFGIEKWVVCAIEQFVGHSVHGVPSVRKGRGMLPVNSDARVPAAQSAFT